MPKKTKKARQTSSDSDHSDETDDTKSKKKKGKKKPEKIYKNNSTLNIAYVVNNLDKELKGQGAIQYRQQYPGRNPAQFPFTERYRDVLTWYLRDENKPMKKGVKHDRNKVIRETLHEMLSLEHDSGFKPITLIVRTLHHYLRAIPREEGEKIAKQVGAFFKATGTKILSLPKKQVEQCLHHWGDKDEINKYYEMVNEGGAVEIRRAIMRTRLALREKLINRQYVLQSVVDNWISKFKAMGRESDLKQERAKKSYIDRYLPYNVIALLLACGGRITEVLYYSKFEATLNAKMVKVSNLLKKRQRGIFLEERDDTIVKNEGTIDQKAEGEDDSSDEQDDSDTEKNPIPVKRGRGRPKKNDTQARPPEEEKAPSPAKRGRGRPRKHPNPLPQPQTIASGRPRRSTKANVTYAEEDDDEEEEEEEPEEDEPDSATLEDPNYSGSDSQEDDDDQDDEAGVEDDVELDVDDGEEKENQGNAEGNAVVNDDPRIDGVSNFHVKKEQMIVKDFRHKLPENLRYPEYNKKGSRIIKIGNVEGDTIVRPLLGMEFTEFKFILDRVRSCVRKLTREFQGENKEYHVTDNLHSRVAKAMYEISVRRVTYANQTKYVWLTPHDCRRIYVQYTYQTWENVREEMERLDWISQVLGHETGNVARHYDWVHVILDKEDRQERQVNKRKRKWQDLKTRVKELEHYVLHIEETKSRPKTIPGRVFRDIHVRQQHIFDQLKKLEDPLTDRRVREQIRIGAQESKRWRELLSRIPGWRDMTWEEFERAQM